MYGDEKFRALSKPTPNAQSLWVYVLTGPHTTSVPGLFSAWDAGMSKSLGWPLRDFKRCFSELEKNKMVVADWDAGVVWIPNCVTYNPPENPNVVTGWVKAMDEIPECELKIQAIASLKEFVFAMRDKKGGIMEGFRKAFEKGFRKWFGKAAPELTQAPFRKQEQEQEHEQEQDIASDAPSKKNPADDPAIRDAAREAFELWSRGVRGHGLKLHENENAPIVTLLGVLAQEPPVIHGSSPTGQHLLVPRAVECLRLRTPPTPMKSMAYACKAVQNLLAEWQRDGMPGSTKTPQVSVFKPVSGFKG